ncbi:MAG: EF-Tu/IF-2/RF-3 family GTPase [Candidatus Hydrothermarchaeaceae archaeon]
MAEKVGEVFTYFAKIGVAGVKITDGSLSVGDKIKIEGATTNIEQTVDSMQIDKNSVQSAEKGQSVGIKVKDRVRPNDVVYKV